MEPFSRIEFPRAEVKFSSKKIAIILAQGWKNYYASSPFYWFMSTKHPQFDVMVSGPDNMSVSEIMEKLRTNDYIGALLCETSAPAFFKFDMPKMIITDDIHRWFRNYKVSYYEAVSADTPILSCYSLAAVPDEVPLSASRMARTMMVYCPHYVWDSPCTRAHIDRQPVGICGGLSELTYPVRARMAERFSKFNPRPKRAGIRADFIDILGDYRINVTDDVRFGYMVAKYFEIPMSGSLLVAPEPHSEIEKFMLGFNACNSALLSRDKMYDDDYIERIIGDAIADRSGTEQRAFSGQALARKRHTLEARVRYIWSIFQRMDAGNWSIRDQFDLFLASERNDDSLLDASHGSGSATQATNCDPGARVALSIETGYDFRDVVKKLGPKPNSVTVVAATITQCERTVSQLAEALPGTNLSYVLRDRTIADRIAYRHDAAIISKRGETQLVDNPQEMSTNWTHMPDVDMTHRQNILKFWRNLETRLKDRFGNAVIHMTIDENYDHTWGGISYWYWLSRRDCARVRVERILKNEPIIGFFRPDGYDASVGNDVNALVEPILGASQASDHWQIFFTAPDINTPILDNDFSRVEEMEAQFSDCIGHMLRLAIDDVCRRQGGDAPM